MHQWMYPRGGDLREASGPDKSRQLRHLMQLPYQDFNILPQALARRCAGLRQKHL